MLELPAVLDRVLQLRVLLALAAVGDEYALVEWRSDVSTGYQVSRGYKILVSQMQLPSPELSEMKVLNLLWKIFIPYRIKALGWWVSWIELCLRAIC